MKRRQASLRFLAILDGHAFFSLSKRLVHCIFICSTLLNFFGLFSWTKVQLEKKQTYQHYKYFESLVLIMAAPSNNSIKGLVPPTVVVDAVIYPRTRKGIYPVRLRTIGVSNFLTQVTVSVQQEWRFQHGLFKQDIVQAVLNSHCCAPNALDQGKHNVWQ